jgi:LasA protease
MDTRLKHGTSASQKTKSNVKRWFAGGVLLTWVASILACSQGYVSGVELTQTAAANPSPVTASIPTHTRVPSEIPTRAPAVLPDPTDTKIPSDATTIVEAVPEDTPTLRFTPTHTRTSTPGPSPTARPPILYYAQAGDTLVSLSVHFGVTDGDITSPDPIATDGYIRPNQLLIIPDRLDLESTDPKDTVIPDSEVVDSPTAVNFDINTFVNEAGGYLSHYREYMSTGWNSGADVIKRVAVENSINPRLLLALVEYQSHWVYGQPESLAETDYPIGFIDLSKKDLYKQLSWAVEQLSIGYYGWQSGLLTQIEFANGSTVRLYPKANAGTVAVAYLFSRLYNSKEWANLLHSKDLGFPALYQKMYGNPWLRAQSVEPLFPADFSQPKLELPYPVGENWSFSGGPHPAWGPNGALAAVDFAPPSIASGCTESNEWVTASATGLVVRTGTGIVVVDLDGDGKEETGWVLLYLHIATKDRVQVGTWLSLNDRIGHPSCEGGLATGTHVHMARKYNGQWMLADGPIPMVLSGWRVHAGDAIYVGSMTRAGQKIVACTCGSFESRVMRFPDK